MKRRIMGSFNQSSKKPIKFYLDTMSQPCRALQIFLQINQIPYEPVYINLVKLENMSYEFEKINPLKRIPVIDDNGLVLIESIAIFRYLCRNYKIEEKWYPRDQKKRAYVDEYLEWQHTSLRAPLSLYFFATALEPALTGEAPHPHKAESRRQAVKTACDDLNDIWLKGKPYVAGQEISFADLLAACEILQLRWTDYDPKEGRPALSQWLDRVRRDADPFFDQAHNKLTETFVVAAKL